MAERTSWRKISAPPPVSESRPAALSSVERLRDRFLRQPGQVQDFDGREAFELQARVQRPQRLQHVGVVTERQRRMQSADDVQLRDTQPQRLARLLDNLLQRELEAVGVALLAGERAELAAQNAVVRVVDVAVDDVAGAVAHLAPPGQVCNGAQGIQILAFEQPQRVGLGNPLAGGDLFVEVANFAVLDEKLHR